MTSTCCNAYTDFEESGRCPDCKECCGFYDEGTESVIAYTDGTRERINADGIIVPVTSRTVVNAALMVASGVLFGAFVAAAFLYENADLAWRN